MLRFNITRAMKLPAAREYAIPAPFPGKYPTRVGMVVGWEREGKKGFWRYVGKPNGVAAQRFEKELKRGELLTVGIMEWDCAWMITQGTWSWERPQEQVTPNLEVVSPWLWTVYHPWHDQRLNATRWMREKFWIHRISCALGENIRLYSPMKTMGGAYLADYRKRVNVVGQQKEKKSARTDWTTYRTDVLRYTAPDIVAPVPVEPAPEPLWGRAAQAPHAAPAAQDTMIAWEQRFQETQQQTVPGRTRPRRRNGLFGGIRDAFGGERGVGE